jgi:hypothetical protein
MAKMPRSGRLPCKKHTNLLLSTTLRPWCHSPRVGSPFLANGCSIKHGVDGEVERYKARLVTRGYTQTFEVDYNETFAPIAKFVSIRCIIALAAIEDMEIHQMDVKTAFFNDDLEEEIYMEQPEEFTQEGEHLVCKLHKSLYGLKQSPRAWNQKLDAFVKNIEFVRSHADFSMYVAQVGDVKFFIVIIVNDLILVCNNKDKFSQVKEELF